MNVQLAHKLSTAARFLGLAQARCFHCLRPFSPDAEIFSASTAWPPAGFFDPDASLCPSCRDLLVPYRGPRCPLCGLPAPMPSALPAPGPVGGYGTSQEAYQGSLCGRCLADPPPWTRAAFYGLYRQSLRHALLRLKFDGHLYLAPLLGAFLLEAAHCLPGPDALLAVPQYPDHLRHRGYNQAHELAKVLHNYTGVPLATQLLTRPVPGKEQARLGARARRSNVQHSFNASAEANGLHVWLVDDVMTTGSTMAAATKALLGGGVTRVDAVFVARTPRNTPN